MIVRCRVRGRIAVAAIALAAAGTLGAAPPSAAGGDEWRPALCVQLDASARMYVAGERVDTLRVYRGQVIRFEKRDETCPDLTVQFERKLFRRRHPHRLVIAGAGKPRFAKVDPRAGMKVYAGVPEKGFDPDLPANARLMVRVIPPPSR